MSKTGVKVRLVGTDGNAFAILSKVEKAMRDAGVEEDAIKVYHMQATAGDYDNLLSVTQDWVDVI